MRRLGSVWPACALAVLTAAFIFATGAAADGGHGSGGGDQGQQSSQSDHGSWGGQPKQDQSKSDQGGRQSSGSKGEGDKGRSGDKHAGDNGTNGSSDRTSNQGQQVKASEQESRRPKSEPSKREGDHGVKAASVQQESSKGSESDHKITICHATGSSTNPFVLITVDKHALKEGHTVAKGDIIPAPAGGCPSKQVAVQETEHVKAAEVQKSEVQKQESSKGSESDHKITICHATGSSTNPFVLITVDKHALKEGHTVAKGDIIPAPAGGCPALAPQSQTSVQTVTFCDMESATLGKLETKSVDKIVSHELNGTPEEARDIVPPFTVDGRSYSQGWDANGQAIFNAGCNAAPPAAQTGLQAQQKCTSQESQAKSRDESDKDEDHGSGRSHDHGSDRAKSDEHASGGKESDERGSKVEDNDADEACVQAASPGGALVTPNAQAPQNQQPTQVGATAAAGNQTPLAQVSPNTATPATGATQGANAAAPAGQGNVLGAQTSLTKPKHHGVLHTIGNVAGATLPFTGFPVWAALLAALALLTAGLVLRRRGAGDRL